MPKSPAPISDQLRAVITSRRLTAYHVAKESGLNVAAVGRFLNGTRGLTLASADKLAAALGLRVIETGRRAPAKPRPGTDQ